MYDEARRQKELFLRKFTKKKQLEMFNSKLELLKDKKKTKNSEYGIFKSIDFIFFSIII